MMTYNQELTVGRTLDSILAQKTKYSYEIIIGEDASPSDRTRSVCESYVNQYPDRIHLLPKAPNKGVLNNYIDCLAQCKGKYIAGCAGDDWWSNENKIELQVDFLEENPDYVLCYSGYLVHNLSSNKTIEIQPTILHKNQNTFGRLVMSNFIAAPTACYRHSVIKHIDFRSFMSNGYRMEDYPMWLIISHYGKFHAIKHSLVTYSQSTNSMSNHDELGKQIDFEENTLRIKQDIVKQLNLQNKYSDNYILDCHYRMLYNHSIRFNDRQSALKYIIKVQNKNIRDLVKVFVAIFPFTFKLIVKRNSTTSAV
ncbi:MAG: glycosyltransferase [Mucinivorans sp.]